MAVVFQETFSVSLSGHVALVRPQQGGVVLSLDVAGHLAKCSISPRSIPRMQQHFSSLVVVGLVQVWSELLFPFPVISRVFNGRELQSEVPECEPHRPCERREEDGRIFALASRMDDSDEIKLY